MSASANKASRSPETVRQATSRFVTTTFAEHMTLRQLPSPEQVLVLIGRLKRRSQQRVRDVEKRRYQQENTVRLHGFPLDHRLTHFR